MKFNIIVLELGFETELALLKMRKKTQRRCSTVKY